MFSPPPHLDSPCALLETFPIKEFSVVDLLENYCRCEREWSATTLRNHNQSGITEARDRRLPAAYSPNVLENLLMTRECQACWLWRSISSPLPHFPCSVCRGCGQLENGKRWLTTPQTEVTNTYSPGSGEARASQPGSRASPGLQVFN